MIQLILLGSGLAMDAFSVCLSFGVCHPKSKIYSALRLAFFTGFFQFLMPLIGWFIGELLGKYFFKYSNWIAFGILTAIGLKMIIEAIIEKEKCDPVDISRGKHLIIVCLATSIDALAAGLSLGIMNMPLLMAATVIGCITFIFSFSGVYLGKIAGYMLGRWAEILGGTILIGIGIKILSQNFV